MLTQCFPYNIVLFLGLEEASEIVFRAEKAGVGREVAEWNIAF